MLVALAIAGLVLGQPSLTEATERPEPLVVTVEVGREVTLNLGQVVTGVSVKNPTLVLVEPYADGARFRGLASGRTLVVLWTMRGRNIVVVRVDPARAVRMIEPLRYGGEVPEGASIFVYHGNASGSGSFDGSMTYAGQEHAAQVQAPVMAGSARAAAAVDVAVNGDARLSFARAGYEDLLLSLEAGDLSLGSQVSYTAIPLMRGGAAGYHDAKYRVMLFGGALVDPAAAAYTLSGPLQAGAQGHMVLAENLSLGVESVRTHSNVAGELEPRSVVSPSLHWLPTTSIMVDAEGAVSDSGGAGRLRASYDAPLLSVHSFYQVFGQGFTSPGAPLSNIAQATLFVTPSPYYVVSGLAGRTTTGAPLFTPDAASESEFLAASAGILPGGDFSRSRYDFRYAQSLAHVLDEASQYSVREIKRSAEATLSYRLTAHDQVRIGARGEDARQRTLWSEQQGRQRVLDRSYGPYTEVTVGLWRGRLSLVTAAGLQRLERTTIVVGGETQSTTDFLTVNQGVRLYTEPVFLSLNALYTRTLAGAAQSENMAGTAELALRPAVGHELRAQATLTRSPLPLLYGEEPAVGADFAGTVGYTYRFGSTPDVGNLFGMFGSSLRIFVFLDANENGVRETEEGGVDDVTLVVDDNKRLDTDASGSTRFSGLSAGGHDVRVDSETVPGFRFTTASHLSVYVDPEEAVTVEIGVTDRGRAFGIVFNDTNLDGEMQPNEPGVSGVHVIAGTEAKALARTVTVGGSFTFKGLAAGDYVFGFDPRTFPANYVWAGPQNGNGNGAWYKNGTNGHDGGNGHNGGNGHKNGFGSLRIAHLAVERSGVSFLRVPLRALRTVEGRVFWDRDGSGNFTASDQPLGGVSVRAGGRQISTDQEGRYLFRDLPAGPLAIGVDPLSLPPGLAAPEAARVELRAEPSSQRVDLAIAATR